MPKRDIKDLEKAVKVVLDENYTPTQKSFVAGMPVNTFMEFIHESASTSDDKSTYDKMLQDGTVSNVVNAYMSDLVVRDKVTNHVCSVICEDPHLVEELETFLYEDLDIDNILYTIALRMFCYGCSPVELCSIDSVTDDQWKLYSEAIKNKVRGVSLVEETKNAFGEKVTKLKENANLELPSFKEVLNEALDTGKIKGKQKIENTKRLIESMDLKEDQLNIVQKGFKKRWYINLYPSWRIRTLSAKGKDICYIDPDDTETLYEGSTVVPFMNRSATDASTIFSKDGSDSYSVVGSESFLSEAKTAYKVLSAFEDLLLIHALTTAINYRIFQVDVGALGDKETVALLRDIKQRIHENESFNVETSFYESSMTGVPMGASIIIPTRGGVGTLSVQQIDNNFGTSELGDFNYFRDKLANALMANPAILGNSTNGNGALATGAATEVLDDRAHEYIEKYRLILAANLEMLCDIYLRGTRSKYKYSRIPLFSIRISKNTSRDQARFNEAQESAAQSLQQVISALDKAKIDLSQYPETRIELIRQFLGDEIADKLTEEDEKRATNASTSTPSGGDDLGGDLGDDLGGDLGGDLGEAPIEDVSTETENTDEGGDIEEPVLEPGIEV